MKGVIGINLSSLLKLNSESKFKIERRLSIEH